MATIDYKQKIIDCMNSSEVDTLYKSMLNNLFPELKESEDERIRKKIIQLVNDAMATNAPYKKEMLAWLEKQGEHANFRNKIQIGDKVTRNKDGVLVNLSQLNRVAKKQGEQKPVWSEEDEKMFEHIIAKATLHFSSINYLDEEEINFLKSLKDRYTWKPSDEQMDALHYVTNFDYGGHKATLVSLYEQLKKLREE